MSDHFIVMAEGRVVGELKKGEATDSRIMEMAVSTFKEFLAQVGSHTMEKVKYP